MNISHVFIYFLRYLSLLFFKILISVEGYVQDPYSGVELLCNLISLLKYVVQDLNNEITRGWIFSTPNPRFIG